MELPSPSSRGPSSCSSAGPSPRRTASPSLPTTAVLHFVNFGKGRPPSPNLGLHRGAILHVGAILQLLVALSSSSARCPMSSARCPMSSARCPMSSGWSPMSPSRCPRSPTAIMKAVMSMAMAIIIHETRTSRTTRVTPHHASSTMAPSLGKFVRKAVRQQAKMQVLFRPPPRNHEQL